MSSSLYRLGLRASHTPKRIILAWLGIIVLLGALAGAFGDRLSDEFAIPGTEAQQGLDNLETRFPEMSGTSGEMVFRTTDGSPIDSHRDEITAVMKEISTYKDVVAAPDPYGEHTKGVTSEDGTALMGSVQMDGGIGSYDPNSIEKIQKLASEHTGNGLEVIPSGQMLKYPSVPISITEALGVFAALIILAVSFRSLVAAFIPIVTALVGVGIAMLLMFAGTSILTVSSTAPTLAVMIGLAVGIDYSLFIVSRHIDQLRDGMAVDESIGRATATSGSAVVFAGMTVVIALIGLFITGIPFLTIMGVVSAIAVAANVAVALTLLPAILALLGERLRPKSARSSRNAQQADGPDHRSGSHAAKPARTPLREKWVRLITRVPALTLIVVLAATAALIIPAKDLRLALPDQGTEPVGSASRVGNDVVVEEFGEGYTAQILVTADIVNSTDPVGVVDELAARATKLDGVRTVQLATPNRGADMGVVVLIPEHGSSHPSTAKLVEDLRDHAAGWEKDLNISQVTVTGSTAAATDITARLSAALIPFGIFVVGLSLVLLAIVFRSIWVPIKAALGFFLSIGVAFGVSAMVFEYGWGADMLNIAATGPVISFMPIIVMGVLFGLAMDYEVFLVSRMREDFTHTRDAKGAITRGFTHSAPVVIAAALIMLFIFAAFVPESTFEVQPIALALAAGVFVDAFIVRMTLVPAVLALIGERAWHLPAWLDRLLPNMDVEGEGLATVLEHQAWTREHGRAVIRLNEVTAPLLSGTGTLGPISEHVRSGEIMLVTAPTADERDTFTLLSAGRLLPESGHVVIGDRIIPLETGAAQQNVLLTGEDPVGALTRHRPSDPTATAVVLPSLAALVEADGGVDALLSRTRQGSAAVIAADTDPAALLDQIDDLADVRILDLADLRTRPTDENAEVLA
ncbi:MMPL family transporter [Helcobacillus sp. ACRRO]|uniref:MMPL family transporter n=1 Tax=Helcobacillus sp. ACRRO TaxID=2918202 RepID=UPI001EF4E3E3|nr:MMPL family transporter [Helcobacillus sp. ACRRO]